MMKGDSKMESFRMASTSSNRTWSRLLRLCVWAGIIGPILYVLVFTLDGALRPGYSPYAEAVSYLLLGSRGWLEIMNFTCLGLLLIVFALGFLQWSGVVHAFCRRVITALLVISGLGFIMAALFVPDPYGEIPHSIHGVLHNIAFTVVFFPLGLACILIGSQFSKIVGWRIHGWFSVVLGLLVSFIALASLIFPASSAPRWGGLFERVFIVIILAWLGILAIRILVHKNG